MTDEVRESGGSENSKVLHVAGQLNYLSTRQLEPWPLSPSSFGLGSVKVNSAHNTGFTDGLKFAASLWFASLGTPGLLSDCTLAALVSTFLIIVAAENGTLHTTAATARVNLGVLHDRLPPDVSELLSRCQMDADDDVKTYLGDVQGDLEHNVVNTIPGPAQLETISPWLPSPDFLLYEEKLDTISQKLLVPGEVRRGDGWHGQLQHQVRGDRP